MSLEIRQNGRFLQYGQFGVSIIYNDGDPKVLCLLSNYNF